MIFHYMKTLSEYKELLHSLEYYIRHHGIKNTIKLLLYRRSKQMKQRKLDLSQEQIVKVNDCDFCVMPYDKGISAELIMYGIHEPLTTKLISQNVKKNMVCIDLGSNIGYYASLESRLVGENGKIIAIEPSPQNYEYLVKNLAKQKFSNSETHNFALSDIDGNVRFLIKEKSNLSQVIDNDRKQFPGENIIDVPSKKLDSFLLEKSLTRIDFLRMDVEGYELKIYKGMKETIRKYKPILLMELHKSVIGVEDVKKFLTEIKNDGYKLQHYIDRAIDEPTLAKDDYIENINFDNLFQRLERNFAPGDFTLLFIPI